MNVGCTVRKEKKNSLIEPATIKTFPQVPCIRIGMLDGTANTARIRTAREYAREYAQTHLHSIRM